MPGKSRAADAAAAVSEEAIRQRAYYLWENDGRPDGRGDHYWHLAHEEAHRAMVEETASRTAKITKGRNPAEMPPEVKATGRGTKAKVKAADESRATKAVKAKSSEAKLPKRAAPKPRAAIQKAH